MTGEELAWHLAHMDTVAHERELSDYCCDVIDSLYCVSYRAWCS